MCDRLAAAEHVESHIGNDHSADDAEHIQRNAENAQHLSPMSAAPARMTSMLSATLTAARLCLTGASVGVSIKKIEPAMPQPVAIMLRSVRPLVMFRTSCSVAQA